MNARVLLVAATACGTIAGVTRMIRNRLDARRVVRAAEDICIEAAYTTDPKSWPGYTITIESGFGDIDAVLEAIKRWKNQ